MNLRCDPILKDYFHNSEHFSDMFNALFYDGKQVISPSIIDSDSDSSSLFDMNHHDIIAINRTRDILFDATFVLIGIENQGFVDYTMPLRNLLYDALTYNKQYRLYQQEKKKNKHTQLHLIPVISVVFYYGEKHWSAPRSLLEMMDIPQIYQNHKINDWNIHIVDIKDIDLSLLHNDDNRKLVDGVQRLYRWDGNLEHLEDITLSRDVAIAVAAITGKIELLNTLEEEKGDVIHMCSSIEKCLNKGRQDGFMQGQVSTIIKQLKSKLNLPEEIILKIEQSSQEQIEKLTIHIFDINSQEDILHLLSS